MSPPNDLIYILAIPILIQTLHIPPKGGEGGRCRRQGRRRKNERKERIKGEGGEGMKKVETIKRYGEEAYEKQRAQMRTRYETHPEEVIANHQEEHRKGGIYYEKHLEYQQTGLPGEKNRIRNEHARDYKPYKDIIAPDSQIHHEWIRDTAEYRGVALVEATPHQYGIIDVILILDGKITLLTEEEVRNKGKKKEMEKK